MKKLSYLIVLALILSLVLTGCLLSNVGQVPTNEQSGITYLTKGPSPDLVGLWHFDGDALDSSGKGLDGALSLSGASFVVDGFGQALNVDGTGWVQVPDSSLLEPSEITVEAWVKRLGSPGAAKYIVSKYLPNKYGSYSSYGLYTGSGGIRFYIGLNSGWIGSAQAPVSVIWDGNWHHVAGTFDGSEVKLYIDRIQVDGATSTIQDIYYYETGNLYIGAYTDSSYLAFSGTIDEVRIWKVALTALQLGDMTPPVITMLGFSPVTVEVGSTYTDAGATALDNVDGNITGSIITVNTVDIATIGIYTVNYDVSDAAGNSAIQVTRIVNVVDTTPPVITLVGVTPVNVEVGSTYIDAGATATDNYDGVITGSIVTVNLVNTAVVGTYTVTYYVSDAAGNPAIQVTRTVNVVYKFGGILQPINADGSSIFKLGSTVPVKFQLQDASGAFVTDAVARIYLLKISDGINGTEVEENAVSTSAATTGNFFRYDSTNNQYIFNLATKGLSIGTWKIRIELDDGTSKYVQISLKK